MKKFLKLLPWIGVFIFFFCVFTVLKIPTGKIKNLIHAEVNIALAQMGAELTADEVEFRIVGTRYRLQGAKITLEGLPTPLNFDTISVSPSLLGLLSRNLAATAELRKGDGRALLDFRTDRKSFDLDFKVDELPLGETGVLEALTRLKGSAALDGSGSLSGSIEGPHKTDGDLQVRIDHLKIGEQSLMGFKIPALQVSETKTSIGIRNGKATIRNFQIGQDGKNDDIQAEIKGSITFQRHLASSPIDLEARFSLSDKIKRAFVIVDSLLGAGKKPDGSYAFKLSGSLFSPMPMPLK